MPSFDASCSEKTPPGNPVCHTWLRDASLKPQQYTLKTARNIGATCTCDSPKPAQSPRHYPAVQTNSSSARSYDDVTSAQRRVDKLCKLCDVVGIRSVRDTKPAICTDHVREKHHLFQRNPSDDIAEIGTRGPGIPGAVELVVGEGPIHEAQDSVAFEGVDERGVERVGAELQVAEEAGGDHSDVAHRIARVGALDREPEAVVSLERKLHLDVESPRLRAPDTLHV
eukprot:3455441-Rhodomonas_salina.6